MKIAVFALALLSLAAADFVYDGMNRLTQPSLDSMLAAKKVVLGLWYSPECQKCGRELWEVNYSLFAFGYDQNYLLAANTFGEEKEMEEKYGVVETKDTLVIRLFVPGVDTPYLKDEDEELIGWISKSIKKEPMKDNTFHITDKNYNTFLKKSKSKSALMFYYVDGDSSSQTIALQFFQTAVAFKNMKSVMFASVNCAESRNICGYHGIRMVPELKLIPGKDISFDDKSVDFQRGEQIDNYLNRYLGTFISKEGGLNEKYGRDEVLDDLAHDFMSGEENERKAIMKKILKLKAKHPASFRYYKLMKELITNGDEVLEREKMAVESELAKLPKEGKEYNKMRAMQNVIRQFTKVEIKEGEVLVLTDETFDLVVNGKRNVMVKFYAPWCGHCRALAPIYEELAKEVRTEDAIIAELDADKYKSIALKYGIEGFPTLKWYGKGADPALPEMVDSARTKESLMGYIGEKLYGPLDKEEERKEEMDAEPEMEEDDGDELFSVCLHTE